MLQGAQVAFFLQFPEHFLGPGLELGVVIRDKPMPVSLGTVYLRECPKAHLVADSGTGQVLGTRPVGANKANRIPNPLEFTTWEGRQTWPRKHTNCVVAIGLPITGVIVAMKNCRQMDACMGNAGEVGACGGITTVIKAGSFGDWG